LEDRRGRGVRRRRRGGRRRRRRIIMFFSKLICRMEIPDEKQIRLINLYSVTKSYQ